MDSSKQAEALPFRYGTRHSGGLDGPELAVIVRSPDGEAAGEQIDAVVDTGSVVTVVPKSVIDRIGPNKFIVSRATAWLADGVGKVVETYDVEVCIGMHTYPVKAVAMNRPNILLGRDIINKYLLHLDAPNRLWWIEPSCFIEASSER